jgi:hypothetical protein
MSSEANDQTAEQRLRSAFERLKASKPIRVEPGTVISQNNVAREAGVDPSALRKSRYPGLIREIQAYAEITAHREESAREKGRQRARERISLDERMKELIKQRDVAQAQLLSAHRIIIELTDENARITKRLEMLEPPPVRLQR